MTLKTLPYESVAYLSNGKATKTRNLVNDPSPVWEGVAMLSPASDFWFDPATRPNQNVTIGPVAEFWEQQGNISPFAADRDFWDFISGRPSPSGWRDTEDDVEREAEKIASEDTQTERLVRPFMRGRIITVELRLMKANTRLWAFFDEEDVTGLCRAENESGELITDDNGELTFRFFIPNGRFEVGTKILEVADSEELDPGEITTFATATYSANGLSSQRLDGGIESTQRPRVRQRSRRETPTSRNSDTVSNGLAYTFYVDQPGGMFLSKLGLFFQDADSRNINVRICTVEDGQPTNTIVPYGEAILTPGQINTSSDGTEETTVEFDSPVYLQEDEMYAVILNPEGNSEKYKYWVSELGEADVVTSERVTEELAAGSVYEPADNRTWTEFYQEDFKINIYRAEFDTSEEFTLTFNNRDVDVLDLSITTADDINIGDELVGDTWLRLQEIGETFTKSVGDTIEFDSGITATIVEVDGLEMYVETENIDDIIEQGDTFDDGEHEWTVAAVERAHGIVVEFRRPLVAIDFSPGRFLEGSRVRQKDGDIDRTINKVFDIPANDIRPLAAELVFDETRLEWEVDLYDGISFRTVPLDEGERREFLSSRAILSKSNERKQIGGDKSVTMRARGSSSRSNLSPVVDTSRLGIQTYSYEVDDPEDKEEAMSKYFTRDISLDEDSEDLRVVFDGRVPSGAAIDVLFKAQSSSDERPFNDLEWRLMDTIRYNENVYNEYDLEIPSEYKDENGVLKYEANGAEFFGFSRFAVKFRFRATNTSRYPTLKNFRAIALMA